MNQEVASFKNQYILEELSSDDKGFIYNIAHDSNNDITGIVWITSYTRDNFKRFGNHLCIDVIWSSFYNTKTLCYTILVVKNRIWK